MNFIQNEGLAPMAVEKNQNLGGHFGARYQLNSTAHFARFLGKWAKLAIPRILIYLIVLGAEYSFYVKSIVTYAPQKVDITTHS